MIVLLREVIIILQPLLYFLHVGARMRLTLIVTRDD